MEYVYNLGHPYADDYILFLYFRDIPVEGAEENVIPILIQSIKDTFITLIMKKSTWNVICYFLFFVFIIVSSQAHIMVLLRLEAYIFPLFWTLTDEKVMLFLKTRLKRVFRIYQFS